MVVEVEITGMDEIERKLRALANPRLAKNAARRSARKAMAIVRDAARNNAKGIDDPETVEKIWKNVTISAGKTRDQNAIVMRVGVNGGAGANKHSKNIVMKERRKKGEAAQTLADNTVALPGGNTRHFRYVELGTSEMPPTPFMRPALENNIQAVTDSFAQNFSAELDKELAKL